MSASFPGCIGTGQERSGEYPAIISHIRRYGSKVDGVITIENGEITQ